MYNLLYNVLIYFFEMLIAFAYFSRAYEKKLKNNFIVMLVGSLMFVPAAYVFELFNSEVINLSLFFLINLAFALICFNISVKDAIIFSVLLDAIMFASELLVIYFVSSVFKLPTEQYRKDMVTYVILSSTSKLLYLAISQLLAVIVKKNNKSQVKTKRFLPLFVFPIIIITFSAVVLYLSLKIDLQPNYQFTIALLCILSIFACVFIFIYYQWLSENEAKVVELEKENQFYEINKTYLDVLQHQNDELQMLFHDTKHHYLSLSCMDNIEEVREYISKISSDYEETNRISYSNNKLLDIILNKYAVICKKQDISFYCEVRTANLNYIDDSELTIILNNLLDNAIEAAQNSKEKVVEVSIRHINSMDLLSVINSCDTPPRQEGNHLLTSKINKSAHGFGTRIINKHATINNGTYEWFYDEHEKRFHSNILFKRN